MTRPEHESSATIKPASLAPKRDSVLIASFLGMGGDQPHSGRRTRFLLILPGCELLQAHRSQAGLGIMHPPPLRPS
jgi:hypothetical protein